MHHPARAHLVGTTLLIVLSFGALSCGGPSEVPKTIVEDYLDRYFATFPTLATGAGRHDFDDRLEDLDADARLRWIDYNRQVIDRAERLLAGGVDPGDGLDLELLVREARRQVFEFAAVRRPERDPLYWTGIAGNATVFLLVREDRPLADRMRDATSRASTLPRLLDQAREALAGTDPAQIAPEHCAIVARQAEASAAFYRDGFADAGEQAADALEGFSSFLRELEATASGSPRLGEHYADAFRIGTGIEDPLGEVLARAEAALAAKRGEAAEFGRSVWDDYFAGEAAPADDGELLRRLFDRVAEDRATTVEAFVGQYRDLVEGSIRLVREQEIITLPEPLTLHVDRSPSFFVGQSVGGVYPAGPFEPEADTLWYLPTPSDAATAEQREAFFRDFNDHFNVMITPHEIIPGHYLQLKYAARHPRKLRALFLDKAGVDAAKGSEFEILLGVCDAGGRVGDVTISDTTGIKPQQLQGARTVIAHSIIMGGFPPDHTTKGDKTIKIRLPVGDADCSGDFQRTGHLNHVITGAGLFQRGLGPGQHIIGDILIIRCHNDQHL